MKKLILACLVFATPLQAGQEEAGGPTLEDLAFFAGCWRGSFGPGGVMEEIYTTPSKNLILGTTRFLRDGRTVQYEFIRIEDTRQGILMTPYPGGKPSEHAFRLTSLSPDEAIFEAPEHDYPKRIIYRANEDGSRTARIDAGSQESRAQEWRLHSAPCPGEVL